MSFLQPPDPPEDPRDEEERMQDYAKGLAKEAGVGEVLLHDVPEITVAIMQAIERERKESVDIGKLIRAQFDKQLAEEQARNKLIQDAMADDFAKKEVENMRSVVAGVLESLWVRRVAQGRMSHTLKRVTVTVDVSSLPTVWDRYTLESIAEDTNGRQRVTFELRQK